MPQSRIAAAQKIARELLEQGLPVLLVPKKDGTCRFAIDFRKVNALTRMDPTGIPHAKLALHALGGNRFFSCMDMLASFWQQPLVETDRKYTAFSMPGVGQLQWTVLPMGLRNSPQTQQRAMEQLIAGLDPEHVLCYIDDLIVATESFEEHLVLLDLLFRRLTAAGLALKFSKCEFVRRSASYLGHIISADGIRKDPRLVKKIVDLPTPTDLTSLRGFLGMTGYYRDFVPGYSELAMPLTDQASPKRMWDWTPACAAAWPIPRLALGPPGGRGRLGAGGRRAGPAAFR